MRWAQQTGVHKIGYGSTASFLSIRGEEDIYTRTLDPPRHPTTQAYPAEPVRTGE
jgi:hypothetical protein